MTVQRYDVVIVGAEPAGCSTALAAARGGARVLVVERRPEIGRPVQCAEYVPRQLKWHVPWSSDWVAQEIAVMCTHLPDGQVVETPAAGYLIYRALFDQGLAAAARRAGAQVMMAAQALEPTTDGLVVGRGEKTFEVVARVVVGADGSRSTVGGWLGRMAARC